MCVCVCVLHAQWHSPHFDVVCKQPAVDGLGGMCHEHTTLEGGLHRGKDKLLAQQEGVT